MADIAEKLAMKGFTLRTGGADGADAAFEHGADRVSGMKEVFLPWKGFNGSQSNLFRIPEAATELASKIHPAWSRCSQGAQKLHARNTQQILGQNLDSESGFVICYARIIKGVPQGGTATAIKLAVRRSIPVFNLALSSFTADQIVSEVYGS
jgi:hypothetical protein